MMLPVGLEVWEALTISALFALTTLSTSTVIRPSIAYFATLRQCLSSRHGAPSE